MSVVPKKQITTMLRAWHRGDAHALDQLTPVIYPDLQRIARFCMAREDSNHILQNTALISETYLRLVQLREVDWQDRSHFFAVVAQLMRRILTDYARSRQSLKRGGSVQVVCIDDEFDFPVNRRQDLLAINDALTGLTALDKRKSQVVELHFYGGYSFAEIADSLNISEITVRRDWKFAKLWLLRELTGDRSGVAEPEPLLGTAI